MAINFIPELWEAGILVPFDQEVVYAQPRVVNTDYEGTFSQKGDTVHVSSIADPTVNEYDKTVDLDIEDLADSSTEMKIDQGHYFAFYVNDVDKKQAAGNFQGVATTRAAVKMKDKVDTHIGSLLLPGSHADNRLGRVTIVDGDPNLATVGQTSAYQVLVKLAEKLNKKGVPTSGRWVVVPGEMLSALLVDPRFIHADKLGTPDALLNGQVGRAAGFDILVSNNVPKVGGTGAAKDDYVIAAGTNAATSFAQQLTETETFRSQKRFSDVVRGLQIFGAKVFRPEALATATATFVPATLPAAPITP